MSPLQSVLADLQAHLEAILSEAKRIVDAALAGG